ncbi:MAG: TetM/TetW/TetO/TetS family tetracycline resistance ribosomal protection protein [Bacteroidales bacterium]|nr:TetM/TetW/TetO/TetS family tetracycline resistance ribosomal protection protein [Bacteroidales bacterium]
MSKSSEKPIRNIGIVAHVDAGKTTITENFLFLSGTIRQKGSVDSGSAVTDSLPIEKERGISVRSASNSFTWQEHQINIVDTPGHADFFGEVDRVLGVLDGVILAISAVEGLQASVYVLWEALRHLHIPVVVFINKIDRPGSDYHQIISDIEREFGVKAFPLNVPAEEGSDNCKVVELHYQMNGPFDPVQNPMSEKSLEGLAELDESFLEEYLEGKELDQNRLNTLIKKYTSSGELLPIFCGSAKLDKGMEELMQGIVDFIPEADQDINGDLSARIFKIEHDKLLGRVVHVRVFNGILKNRDLVYNSSLKKEEKVAQIRRNQAHKSVDTSEIRAGDIGIVSGFSEARPGDVLGRKQLDTGGCGLQIPVLLVKVKPVKKEEIQKLADALTELYIEDPMLDFKWFREDQEFQLKLMGGMQKEILTGILKNRFGVEAEFEPPTVIYKETPTKLATGYVEYTMPKPCWAVMKFEVEPLPSGSGLQFVSEVRVDDIQRKYQNEVEATIPKSLQQGIKGWEVTDLKITMTEGEDHEMHSRPGDFVLATAMGVMRALKNADTNLLEPVYNFVLVFPEEYLGPITSDLSQMRGNFDTPDFSGGMVRLNGKVPVATSLDYPIRISSLTSGRAQIRFTFGGYQACTTEQGKIREYKGVNPLDESLWILHNRGAYKADER